jgi:beta-N-acetylhexosaminidase
VISVWLVVRSLALAVAMGVACALLVVTVVSRSRSGVSGGLPLPAYASGLGGGVAPQATSPTDAGGTLPTPNREGMPRAVGQMLMSHVTGYTASAHLLARIRKGEVGSVILYRNNISSGRQLALLTGTLQAAARAGGNPPLLIGTDQEGGSVRRLTNAPPTLSAEEMGLTNDPRSVATAQGYATGKYLRRLGINLDFAPVSDIPTTADNFLHDRAFGHSRRSVVLGAAGFAIGLAKARVAASAKHFPGLGAAGPRDTDFELVSIAATREQLRASYAPYTAMARLGLEIAPMVMISDAVYPSLCCRSELCSASSL